MIDEKKIGQLIQLTWWQLSSLVMLFPLWNNECFVAEVSIFTVEGVCLHPETRHVAIKWAPTTPFSWICYSCSFVRTRRPALAARPQYMCIDTSTRVLTLVQVYRLECTCTRPSICIGLSMEPSARVRSWVHVYSIECVCKEPSTCVQIECTCTESSACVLGRVRRSADLIS